MSIKKGLSLLMAMLIAGLLFACGIDGREEETPPPQNSGAFEPTATPDVTAAPDDVAATPGAPVASAAGAEFGRYAAAFDGGLYYVQDGSIAQRRGDGERKLFDLPETGTIGDLFAAANADLYFTMTKDPSQKSPSSDRVLYRAAQAGGTYSAEPLASIKGPMIAGGQTIYYIENEKLIAYDAGDGDSKEIAQFDGKTELFSWGFFDGKALYYSVYDEAEQNGTLYGPSRLYRYDLGDGTSALVGDRNRPFSDAFVFGQDGVLYRLTAGESGYTLQILDSAAGAASSSFAVPNALLSDAIGTERIHVDKDGVFMLLGSAAGAPSEGEPAALFQLTAYRFDLGGGEMQELWTKKFPRNAAGYEIDRFDKTVSVLTEQDENGDATLYRLGLTDGGIAEQTAVPDGGTALKKIVAVNGAVLVYAMTGEDNPRPSLVYLDVT